MHLGRKRREANRFVGIEPMEARLFLSASPHPKLIVKLKPAAAHVVKQKPAVKKTGVKTKAIVTPATAAPISAMPGDIRAAGPFASPAVSPAGGVTGPFTPAEISQFYGINAIRFNGITGDGTGQTIGLIDAYSDPKLVNSTDPAFNTSDLHQFDVAMGLPDPPAFSVIPEVGYSSLPTTYSAGWAAEQALDVEWAHALAPMAKIVLVQCATSFTYDLIRQGVLAAENAGASVISMSYIFSEYSSETSTDSVFNNSSSTNVTYLAAAGDFGAASTGYPAFSPYVIGVGGTSITTSDSIGSYGSEVVWNDSSNGHGATGGTISTFESTPYYQANIPLIGGQGRGVPDVAFDADPYTGVKILDTSQSGGGGWYEYGGTSLSSPAWAAIVAIADQGRALTGQAPLNGFNQALPRLYNLPSTDFHDILSGSNSYQNGAGYSAGAGYDLTTGLGTPVANTLVPDLAGVATLTGRVFVDNNSNGIFDLRDLPLAGQTVYLDLNNTGVQTANDPTAVTNSSGGYLFTNQPAGGTVRLASPGISGYVVSRPAGPVAYGTTDVVNLTYFPLSISGNANFTVQLDATGNNTQLIAGGSVVYSVAKSLLPSLSLSLTGSGDSVTVDASNGNPVPAGGLNLSGAVPGESLVIVGTPAGNDAFNVTSSSVAFNGTTIGLVNFGSVQLSLGTGTDSLNVASGSITVLPRSTGHGILVRNFSNLTVAANASAIFASATLHTDRTLVETSSLSVAGQLDLTGNDLIVHNGNLSALSGLIAGAYANGNWNGLGLASSAARSDSTHLTALGILSNNNSGNTLYGGSGQSLFDGQAPLLGDILIKYTYYGDADLSGQITSADYARLDFGYLTNQTGWANGDFNYDNAIDGSDYTLLDNAFNTQGTPL